MGLSYVAILYISNTYGAEVYGRFSLAQTILQFLILLFSLGLLPATVKLTSDTRFFDQGPKNQYLAHTVKWLLLSALICGGLMYLISEVLAVHLFKDIGMVPYLEYVSYLVLLAIFHSFFSEYLRARSRFIGYGLSMYVMPYVLFLGLLLLFKTYQPSGESSILSWLLSLSILTLVLVFFFPWKNLRSDTPYSSKALFKLSFPMMFSAAFIFLSNWTDIFMLGALVSKQEVGIYNAAYKLAILALVVINAVNTVLAPKIAALHGENNLSAIKTEVLSATRLITYVTLPIVLALILLRRPLLCLFGDEFVAGETALMIISIGLLLNAMSGSVGQLLNMTQHQNELKRFTIISVVVNIILNYVLIKQMGIVGAAIASLLSTLLLNVLCLVFIKKEFQFYAFFIPWRR